MNASSFDLARLIKIVFHPKPGERVGVFIDLTRPQEISSLKFLRDTTLITQRIAYEVFYKEMLRRKTYRPK